MANKKKIETIDFSEPVNSNSDVEDLLNKLVLNWKH